MNSDQHKRGKSSMYAKTQIMFGMPKLVAAIKAQAHERSNGSAPPPLPKPVASDKLPSFMLKTQLGPVEDLVTQATRGRAAAVSSRRASLYTRLSKHRRLIVIASGLLSIALTLALLASARAGGPQRAPSAAPQPSSKLQAASEASARPQPSATALRSARRRTLRPADTDSKLMSSAPQAVPVRPHVDRVEAERTGPPRSSSAPRVSAREAAASLAAGDIERAAKLYAELSEQVPEVPAYAAAARILAERAAPARAVSEPAP